MEVKCVFAYVYFMTVEVLLIRGFPARKTSNNNLFFPNSGEQNSINFVPKCPENRTFCENIDNYPTTKFYEILKNSTYEEEYFIPQTLAQEGSMKDRFYAETENYICNSKTRTQYPRVALNVKNEWRYVYNFSKYKQGVTTEECTGDETCTSFLGTPQEVRTKCVQKYSDILLLVADKDGKPVWDLFWFPSACGCAYERIINFNRF